MLEVDPAQIDTPWEPQQIAWRYPNRDERRWALEDVLSIPGATHIVREVLVHGPFVRDYTPLTISQTEDVIDHTEGEFDFLRETGLEIAETQWHIFVDDQDTVRTLARVAIVPGEELPHAYESEISRRSEPEQKAQRLFRKATRIYLGTPPSGRRLVDVDNHEQYRYDPTADDPDVTLVDIEPLYWLSLGY